MMDEFWRLADTWRWDTGASKLRPFVGMVFVPLLVSFVSPGPVGLRLVFGVVGSAVAFVLVSWLLYRRFSEVKQLHTVRLDKAPTPVLEDLTETIEGVSQLRGWEFFGIEDLVGMAACEFPDESVDAIIVLNAPAPGEEGKVGLAFASMMDNGDLMVSLVRQRQLIPLRGMTVNFDDVSEPRAVWEAHRSAAIAGGRSASVEELIERVACVGERPTTFRDAGLWRFMRSWPAGAWRSKGVLPAFS